MVRKTNFFVQNKSDNNNNNNNNNDNNDNDNNKRDRKSLFESEKGLYQPTTNNIFKLKREKIKKSFYKLARKNLFLNQK